MYDLGTIQLVLTKSAVLPDPIPELTHNTCLHYFHDVIPEIVLNTLYVKYLSQISNIMKIKLGINVMALG